MLTGIEKKRVSVELCRLANPRQRTQALQSLGIGDDGVADTLDFLRDQATNQARELLDAPFSKGNRPPTRFSNGSRRVYYAALDWATTQAECGYWYQKEALGTPDKPQNAHYHALTCQLDGAIFDVRPNRHEWRFLVDDGPAYDRCQMLAGQAIERGGDALFCPSARRPDGTTAPVFRRAALSNPRITALVKLTLSPEGTVLADWSPPPS